MSQNIGLNETTKSGKSSNYAWYVVGMLWCIAFFNYADRQALSVSQPLIIEEFGLTKMQMGLIASAFAWVYGLGAPFAGLIIDRIRRKTAILTGLIVWSIICMCTPLSKKPWHLFTFMAAEGLGETFYFPASMSLISDYHGRRTRSRAMSLHQTSVYVGTVLGSVFAGLIGQYYGWRYAFVIFGGLGVVLALVLTAFLREPLRGAADRADAGVDYREPKRMPVKQTLSLIFRTPTVLTCLGAFLCANFVAVVVLSWMATYLKEAFQLNLALAGLTATVYLQVASMVGAPLSGWAADKLRQRTPRGRMLVQAVGVLCAAPFVYVVGSATTYGAMLIIGLTAWGFFKGIYDANIFASVYDVVPAEARGTTAGLMNAIGWLGGGGGPVVTGYLADKVGLGRAITMGAAVYVLAGIILLVGMALFVKKDSEKMQAAIAAK